MPQLVGQNCAICSGRISSTIGSVFCLHCDNPVHIDCMEANSDEARCKSCGADPNSTEAAEYKRQTIEVETLQKRLGAKTQRPTSVTVICWYLIVGGIVSLISRTMRFNDPKVLEVMAQSTLSIPMHFAFLYLDRVIGLLCGIAMLGGENWARWLYAIWGVAALTIFALTSPMPELVGPAAIFWLLITFFLFRSEARLFFTGFDGKRT